MHQKKTVSEVVESSAMPTECKDYINEMQKLVEAHPEAAAQFKESIQQAEDHWKNVPEDQKKAAAESCKQASEQFKQLAAQLQKK